MDQTLVPVSIVEDIPKGSNEVDKKEFQIKSLQNQGHCESSQFSSIQWIAQSGEIHLRSWEIVGNIYFFCEEGESMSKVQDLKEFVTGHNGDDTVAITTGNILIVQQDGYTQEIAINLVEWELFHHWPPPQAI